MSLNKDQIFAIEDVDYKVVDVPKWGDVRIKAMSIIEQIEFENLNRTKKDDSDLIFNMLAICCVDDNGDRLFNKEDIPALQKKSSAPVLFLFQECLSFNSMQPGELEKQAKNS